MLMAIIKAKVICNLLAWKKKSHIVHYPPDDRGYVMGRPLWVSHLLQTSDREKNRIFCDRIIA